MWGSSTTPLQLRNKNQERFVRHTSLKGVGQYHNSAQSLGLVPQLKFSLDNNYQYDTIPSSLCLLMVMLSCKIGYSSEYPFLLSIYIQVDATIRYNIFSIWVKLYFIWHFDIYTFSLSGCAIQKKLKIIKKKLDSYGTLFVT